MYELRWFLITASGGGEEPRDDSGTDTGTGTGDKNPLREKFEEMVGGTVHAKGHYQSRTDTYIYIRPGDEPGGEGEGEGSRPPSSAAATGRKPPDYGLKFRGASMDRHEYLRLGRSNRSLELKVRLDGDEGVKGDDDDGEGGVRAELYSKYEYPSMEGATRALVLRGLLDEGRRREILAYDGDEDEDEDDAGCGGGCGVVVLPIRKRIWKAPLRFPPQRQPGSLGGRRRRRSATVTVEYDELFLPFPSSASAAGTGTGTTAAEADSSSMIVHSFNVEGEDESDVYGALGGRSGIEAFRSDLVVAPAAAAQPSSSSTVIEGGYPALVHWYVDNHYPCDGEDSVVPRDVVDGGAGEREGGQSSVDPFPTASRLVFDDEDDIA